MKKKKLKMTKKNLFLILVLVASIGILITVIAYYNIKIEKIQDYDLHVHVDNYLGVNVDSDKIWFGTVPPGNGAKRTLLMFGSNERDVLVKYKVYGDLKDWVSVEDNFFILRKGERRNITIRVDIPEDAELGQNYTGTLRTIFEKI